MQAPTQFLESLSEALASLSAKTSQSVVRIDSDGRRGGTGVILSQDGKIVTASHVVGRSETVEVELQDGKTYEAKVLGRDAESDVALLKVDASGLVPIDLGESASLKTGQFVLAFANVLGGKPSVTSGIVTSPQRSLSGWGSTLENAIVTDAPLNPGYSGGPLVDASGRMVGLNVAYFNLRGVAVPVDTVKEVVSAIEKDGRVKRAFLGVYLDEVRLPEGLAQSTGLMVLSTELGSPANKAGLAMGDVIVQVDGKTTTSLQDLHKILGKNAIGRIVAIRVLRGEKPLDVQVTPAEAE